MKPCDSPKNELNDEVTGDALTKQGPLENAQIETALIEKDSALRFTRSAEHYDRHASTQRQIAYDLVRGIPEKRSNLVFSPKSIVDLGCGTGFAIEALRARYPDAHILGVDSSSGMIEVSRNKFQNDKLINFTSDDARNYHGEHDLILSSSALQWCQPIAKTLEGWNTMLRPGGLMCISLMVDGTLAELRSARERSVPENLATAKLITTGALRASFASASLEILNFTLKEIIEEYDSADEALRSFSSLGLTGGTLSAGARPLTRAEVSVLKDDYQARFIQKNGKIPATLVVATITALGSSNT